MPPCPTGTASCIDCARKRTSGTASANGDHAGGDQRRVFAQAVAGNDGRHRAAGRDPGAVHGHGSGQHDRLGIGGEVEVFFRTVGDQALQIEAEGIGSFLHGLVDNRVAGETVQHADCLGALSGKQECELAHRDMSVVIGSRERRR